MRNLASEDMEARLDSRQMHTVSEVGKHILVVDDDPDVRDLLGQVLAFQGHSVATAQNGAEALNIFNTKPFDLVMTDFEMPVMKGDELVLELRNRVPTQKIIMVSANWPKMANPLSKVNRCVDKPFKLMELLGVVRQVLELD